MRFRSALLAASSLLFAGLLATAEQRPHYGGTLRLTLREAPQSLDPASLAASGSQEIAGLVFETLVYLDAGGRPQPTLASSWQPEPGNQRWRILLRDGVSFHDGFPVDATSVAASLRASNPAWKVFAVGEMVIVETRSPDPELPAELALWRNAIVHGDKETVAGTGPFLPREWTPGKHLALAANDIYWGGRPFVDSIDMSFGVSDREQMLALDLGKADIAQIAPETIGRARAEGRTVIASEPSELLALVFESPVVTGAEIYARNALTASLDRSSLADYAMQGGGEPTGALLPNWVSGYAFVFPIPQSHESGRSIRLPGPPVSWKLAYDPADPLAHLIADRIRLNARDAGIGIEPVSSGAADLRLTKVPISSSDPHTALVELSRALRIDEPEFKGASAEDLYQAEKAILQSNRVIPLVHLRAAVALRPPVREFGLLPDGGWDLSNVWLAPEKP
jgi:peptide/nickel transport system substrate-binding protein